MAIHIIRKYKRSITIAFVLSAGIPLVFMGSGGFSNMRGQDPYAAMGETIAQVGTVPITAGDFMEQYNHVMERISFGTEPPEVSELVVNGTIEAILESLIQDALIRMETQERPIYPDDEYLATKLKEDPYFYTEDGTFDQAFFNGWVERNIQGKRNWNEIYNDYARQVNREVYTEMIMASARILSKDLHTRYAAKNTQIKVEYITIEPTKEYTDEELGALYVEGIGRYHTLAERTATFVALPLDSADPELRDKQLDRADAIAESASASGDLAAAAAAEGLELKTSSSFTIDSTEIDNVPAADAPLFRRMLIDLEEGAISQPIEGPTQVFIAKIIGVVESVRKPFMDAREEVIQNAQEAYRNSEEFEIRAHEYMDGIEGGTEALAAAAARYPELKIEVKTSPLFIAEDFLFTEGIFWGAREAHSGLRDRVPGAKISLKDFQGTHYVLELAESVKSDAETWTENETTEQTAFREALFSANVLEVQQDYLLHLAQRADAKALIQRDWQAIFALLGLDDSPDTEQSSEGFNLDDLMTFTAPDEDEPSTAAASDPDIVNMESSGDVAE